MFVMAAILFTKHDDESYHGRNNMDIMSKRLCKHEYLMNCV